MKYIMKQPYDLVCINFRDSLNNCFKSVGYQDCNGYPCHLKLCINQIKIPMFNVNVIDDEAAYLINKIDTKDVVWGVQNLQADDIKKRIVANYIVNNN